MEPGDNRRSPQPNGSHEHRRTGQCRPAQIKRHVFCRQHAQQNDEYDLPNAQKLNHSGLKTITHRTNLPENLLLPQNPYQRNDLRTAASIVGSVEL